MQKQFDLAVTLSRFTWQLLIAMATEDLREPTDFINWLIYVEAKRRGMVKALQLPAQNPDDSIAHSGNRRITEHD
jgi:hypothetical protein